MQNSAEYLLLLVDDNPTNLSLLRELIHQNLPECRVMTASNGVDALEMALVEAPDGALLDMQMPGMDGIEVCRRLKADPRTAHTAVILITAHQSTPELRAEGLDAGAQDFISQPIRNVELLARIRALLRIRQVERKWRDIHTDLQGRMARKNATLRWVSGLLSAADSTGALVAPDALRQLEVLLAEDGELNMAKFDGQLFARFPEALRRTLLRVGLIGNVPGPLAESVSEIEDVRGALDYLVRQNYFVDYSAADDSYQFNSPFRDYLVRMAQQDLDAEDMKQTYVRASDWFLERENLARGLDYLFYSGDLVNTERICSQVLPELYASAGIRQLEDHLDRMRQTASDRAPWITLLAGLILLESRPAAALAPLQTALEEFRDRGDSAGTILAGAAILRHVCLVSGDFELGREIHTSTSAAFAAFDLSGQRHVRIQGAFSLGLAELLIFGNLQGADIYLTLALETAQALHIPEYMLTGRIGRGLITLYRGGWNAAMRELELAAGYSRKAGINPSTRQMYHAVMALLLQNMGEVLSCRRQIGLARSEEPATFFEQSLLQPQLALLDVQTELAHGYEEKARDLLDACSVLPGAANDHVRCQLYSFRGLVCALTGQPEEAEACCRQAGELRQKVGGAIYRSREEILIAWTCLALGEWEAASRHAESGLKLTEDLDNPFLRASAMFVRGYARHQLDQSAQAVEDYRNAQLLMERWGYINLYGWNPRLMTSVFSSMVRLGVATEASLALSRNRLYVGYLKDGSPLPTLRFRILGDFSIAVAGRTIHLKDSLTASLRQLLGLLLVSPGCQVEVGEVQSQFWPDSPPEQGRSRIDSLMSRLRKSLEELLPGIAVKHYLHLRRGVVSLENCWVDAMEFESLVRAGLRHARRRESLMADRCFRRAHRLWRGEVEVVLPNDHSQEYFRQDLLLLYFESALAWMDLLLADRQWDEAVELGQRVLRYDPTHENVVRRLYKAGLLARRLHLANQILRDYGKALAAEGYDRDEVRNILDSLEESCRQEISGF
ncbi:MAG: hypothetical protein Tsb0017_16780 [Geothermobacteraceae bacterium]